MYLRRLSRHLTLVDAGVLWLDVEDIQDLKVGGKLARFLVFFFFFLYVCLSLIKLEKYNLIIRSFLSSGMANLFSEWAKN